MAHNPFNLDCKRTTATVADYPPEFNRNAIECTCPKPRYEVRCDQCHRKVRTSEFPDMTTRCVQCDRTDQFSLRGERDAELRLARGYRRDH